MTNICFISNFQKTYFFEKIGKSLKQKGYTIYWICFDKNMQEHLAEEFSKENILLLSKSIMDEGLEIVEDFKLNELVHGDRFLRHQQDWAYKYLTSIQSPSFNFIKENKIKFIFGEVTHAHEILIHRLVYRFRELKCEYLHPQSVRIPNKRFFFLQDEFQSKIFREDIISNKDWKNDFGLIEAVKPRRVTQVDAEVKKELSFKGKWSRAKRFFTQENVIRDLPSQVDSRYKRSIIALKEEYNKLMYGFVNTEDINVLKDKKFVVYTLHMQPEASVDVVGIYYDNQFQNIKNIWRILPSDWFIVIKEHSNAIGNRTFKFFKAFGELKNSILLHEKADSHEVIDLAQAIFTVSGTIAYEAALKGKPAFTFANIFFNKIKNCMNISLTTLREIENIKDLFNKLEQENSNKMSIEAYSKYLYQRSFEGIVDAPVNSYDWYDEHNLELVVEAFYKFLNKFETN